MRQGYTELVSGLSECSEIEVGGVSYKGSYLAMIVAMNPNMPGEEAAQTPQLICELGRLVALAYRDKQMAEMEYRCWRDTLIHRVTNDIGFATNAEFACAVSPGKDAKGNPKPAKLPSNSAAEMYMRTKDEYKRHYSIIAEREEAWIVLQSALEAAKQRTWVVRAFAETSGAALPGDFGDNERVADVSDPLGISTDVGSRRPPPPPQIRR